MDITSRTLRGFRDLKVYQLAYALAMEIFHLSKGFPVVERYALTDQIRRSSRSVPANIAEGYRKRQYRAMFVSKVADADGEAAETQVWIGLAYDCGYISADDHERLIAGYEEVGRMLNGIAEHPERFAPVRDLNAGAVGSKQRQ